jgi:uncharacterized protein (DUF305 family)
MVTVKEMTMLKKLAIVAVVAAAIPAVYAIAQTQSDNSQGGMMGGMMQGEMMMKHGMQMSEADKGYMGAMQTMGQSMMKTEMTGDPSADFVRMMIPHHQSAIDMSEVLLQQKDVDPEIKAMAEEIIKAQQGEIEKFQAWLKKHDQ